MERAAPERPPSVTLPSSDSRQGGYDTPVLIVGGGPVGLTLALDLGWQGVPCTLIEQGDGSVTNAKFVDINMRTMEFCRRWGIAEEIRDNGFDRDYPQDLIFVTSLAGHLLGRLPLPSFAELRAPPTVAERIARCPQTIFDPVMQRAAQSLPGVTLRYNARCDGVTQDADGVTALVTDVATGRQERIRSAYLACCEGAASSLREELGVHFDGEGTLSHSTNITFRSESLLRVHDKGPGFYTAIGPEGRWASMLALDGKSTWRLHSVEKTDADTAIRRFVGRDFDYEILTALTWQRRELVADRYHVGRVFFLGDAVHQLSPSGGFGLNTGIGDVTNLSWKLAAVLQGWGTSALLASYDIERRPVGKRTAATATHLFRTLQQDPPPGPAILADGPEGEAVRDIVRGRVAAMLARSNCGYDFGARYEDAGLQLGYFYEGSPVIVPDGTPAPVDDPRNYLPIARPGSRAPHFWLDENKSVLDLFGRGFVLLRLGHAPPDPDQFEAAAKRLGVPLRSYALNHEHLRALYNKRLVLIRPDGHVAWRGDEMPHDCHAVLNVVRGAGN
jgi:2-polyprenyl-6-methoxyphenol hydroxylase-like FAD-dependent oxidoreductase